MQGAKTHEQQRNIIEKREKTANAGKDFDAKADLNRSEAARKAFRKGDDMSMRTADVSMNDDPSIIRGRNQESEHRKGGGGSR
ncbi:hypothetical protein [Rhizobium sp. LC145]|uniref:hypothetical protein n=1 Tax=Rhizobium sp. LC145 TaxID=1120688 RepID=UPI00062A0104|nr:hypothetical protein [Rhizobium sp. LC145]KKX30697.1 hypothetical protein YH62_14390 [Rhizobium sp. LC145]TKT59468.1 hypothetical protein FDR95_10080 [Rhizobiaceae bacterium LC148]